MADIILKDGVAQEQTYTGISTIKVPQAGGGYAEFSAGGGQTLGDTPLVNMKSLASTLPNTWGVITLTGSPMNIPLYFDVPKGTTVLSVKPYGGFYYFKQSSSTANIQSASGLSFSPSDVDDTTTRYSATLKLTYSNGETHGSASYSYVLYSYIYQGVTASVQNEQAILSGRNAAKFLNSVLFDSSATQPFHIYDMREDTVENLALKVFRSINACKTVYFPAGIVSLADYSFRDMPNLELLDFSLATAVPTLGTSCFGNSSADYQIKVPAALYDEWIAAANWSDFASHIVAA